MTAVAGIDLSLTSTGVCVIDGFGDLHDAAVYRIKSTGGKADNLHLRAGRVVDIADRILQVVPADCTVVIEGPSLGQMRQGGEHQRAGLWWYLVTLLDMQGHEVLSVPPATLKKAMTGKGRASKDEVLAAVIRRYPHIDITGNDVGDAVALAAIGMRLEGHPIDDLPKTHLVALEKLAVAA